MSTFKVGDSALFVLPLGKSLSHVSSVYQAHFGEEVQVVGGRSSGNNYYSVVFPTPFSDGSSVRKDHIPAQYLAPAYDHDEP